MYPDYLHLYVFLSGIIATFLMTIIMYAAGFILGKNFKVMHLLGCALTGYSRGIRNNFYYFFSLVTGTFIHFLVGVGYSFIYYYLWILRLGEPKFIFRIIYGVASGVLAVLAWNYLLSKKLLWQATHAKDYLIAIFVVHILFSIAVFYAFLFLTRYPLPLDQSLN